MNSPACVGGLRNTQRNLTYTHDPNRATHTLARTRTDKHTAHALALQPRFSLRHMLEGETPETLVAFAEEQIKELHNMMQSVAEAIMPGLPWQEVCRFVFVPFTIQSPCLEVT